MSRNNAKAFFLLCLVFMTEQIGCQENRHILGIGTGIIPAKDASIWVDVPVNIWADRRPSAVFDLSYYYRVSPYFQFGSFLGLEMTRYRIVSSETEKADLWSAGLHWLGRYPNSMICWQMGGYLSYGILIPELWDDNPTGVDMGLITGPSYEKGNLGIALHVHVGFGWYPGGDEPDELDLYDPKLILKFTYIFNNSLLSRNRLEL